MRFFERCWGFVIPLLVLLALGPILYISGVKLLVIQLIVQGGTMVVMTITAIYIVAFHSRRRWPGQSLATRLTNYMTLQR